MGSMGKKSFSKINLTPAPYELRLDIFHITYIYNKDVFGKVSSWDRRICVRKKMSKSNNIFIW